MGLIASIFVSGLLCTRLVSGGWGRWWAGRGGQFSEFQKGARSIFDEQEPIGRPTDAFPEPARKPRD